MGFIGRSTSLLVTFIITLVVFSPAVTGQSDCSNVFLTATETSQSLTSPGYPSDYLNNMDCQWTITAASPSEVIFFKVLDLYLEGTNGTCSYDYVSLYNGIPTNSSLIRKLCGRDDTSRLMSTASFVTVVFHSDGSLNYRGFKLEYTTRNTSGYVDMSGNTAQGNNDTLLATGSYKFLTSPSYPYNYPSNTDSQWRIAANSSSQVVVLKLLDLYLEGSSPSCLEDYVTVYDGAVSNTSIMQRLCGQILTTPQFISTGSYITVVFHSDGINNQGGFKLQYSSQANTDTSIGVISPCSNNNLVASGTYKYITSTNYPNNYSSYTDCRMRFVAPTSQVVVLTVLDFSLEGTSPSCTNDYMVFYNGQSTSSPGLQTLCGQLPITQIRSSGSYLTAVFRSDRSNNFRGFRIGYISQSTLVRPAQFNLMASANSSNFTSPYYPYNYTSSTERQWRITAAGPSQIVLLRVLDFSLEGYSPTCYSDYVTIYDGDNRDSSVLQKLCGTPTITQIRSTGPSMTVVFLSDYSGNYRGFKFAYTSIEKSAVCSSSSLTARSTVQYLTSPNYPNPYPSYMDCEWYISSSSYSASTIVLEISRLNLKGPQSNCSTDSVRIYDGSSTYSRQIQVLCGDMENGTFESTGSDMRIAFHSGGENGNNTGFNVTYRSKSTLPSSGSNTDTSYNPPAVPSFNDVNSNTGSRIPPSSSYSSSGSLNYGTYYAIRIGASLGGSVLTMIFAATLWRRRQRFVLRRSTNQPAGNTAPFAICANGNTRTETPRFVRLNDPQLQLNAPTSSSLIDDLPPYTHSYTSPFEIGAKDNTRAEVPLYLRMQGTQRWPTTPANSSSSDDLHPYTPSPPVYSEIDHQGHGFSDQPGHAANMEPVSLLNGQKQDSYECNGETNLAYTDETSRDHVTGQNLSHLLFETQDARRNSVSNA